jgi:hypothetical protein
LEDGGVDTLIEKKRRNPNLKNRFEESVEQAVMAYTVDFPAHDQLVMVFSLLMNRLRHLRVKTRR